MHSHYEEFAVKNSYHLLKNCQSIKPYIPHEEMDRGKFPDRIFWWGIVFTLEPIWANNYYKKVMDVRMAIAPVNINEAKVVKVSEKWMDKLLKFDYQSKGKELESIYLIFLLKHIAKPNYKGNSILIKCKVPEPSKREFKKKIIDYPFVPAAHPKG